MGTLVDALREVDEADVRVVAALDLVDFEIQFMRDDVASKFSRGDLDDAYMQVMANQVSGDDFREVIGATEFEAQSLFFDGVVVFVFPSDRYEGVFASFDREDPFPVNTILEIAADAEV